MPPWETRRLGRVSAEEVLIVVHWLKLLAGLGPAAERIAVLELLNVPQPGSDAALDPGRHDTVAGQPLAGPGVIWAGRDGLYLGRPDGRVERLVSAAFPATARASVERFSDATSAVSGVTPDSATISRRSASRSRGARS